MYIMNNRLAMAGKVLRGYDGVMNPYELAMTCPMQTTNVVKNLLSWFRHYANLEKCKGRLRHLPTVFRFGTARETPAIMCL